MPDRTAVNTAGGLQEQSGLAAPGLRPRESSVPAGLVNCPVGHFAPTIISRPARSAATGTVTVSSSLALDRDTAISQPSAADCIVPISLASSPGDDSARQTGNAVRGFPHYRIFVDLSEEIPMACRYLRCPALLKGSSFSDINGRFALALPGPVTRICRLRLSQTESLGCPFKNVFLE